jgi:hypothetical protein
VVEEVVVHPALVAPVAQAVEAAGAPELRLLLAREVAAELRLRVARVAWALVLVPQIKGGAEAAVAKDMVARQEAMAAPLAEAFIPDALLIIRTRPTSVGPTTPRAVAGAAVVEDMAEVAEVLIPIITHTVGPAAVAGAI